MKENMFGVEEINLQELNELKNVSIIFKFNNDTTISVPINCFKQFEFKKGKLKFEIYDTNMESIFLYHFSGDELNSPISRFRKEDLSCVIIKDSLRQIYLNFIPTKEECVYQSFSYKHIFMEFNREIYLKNEIKYYEDMILKYNKYIEGYKKELDYLNSELE